MPLQKLQFKPGINRENTNYAGEGGWYDCDKIRFRSGYPEKIGGWQNLAASNNGVVNTFFGICRNLWNWITLNSSNLLSLGTEQKLYVENGGAYYDITPIRNTATINTDPFDITTGSKLVTVTDTAHGATVGTYVTFSGATGANYTVFNAEYEIVVVVDANSYQIILATAASATGSGGGASVSAAYQVNAGSSLYSPSTGWGIGPWSRDGWGEEYSGTTVVEATNQLRLWSLDNYGQDLVAAPRQGPIYYWEANTTISPPRAVTLESLANTAGYDGDFVPNAVYEIHTSGVQRFAIALGANPYDPLDSETEFLPMLVRWSDQENIYDWVPSATNQSGEITLSHGSRLVTGRFSRQEFIIWSDSAIYSFQYLGPPYVWGANLLMEGISIASPNAVVGASNIQFWMGMDKFYMYDGRVQTLPCTVRQFVFDNINTDQMYQVVAGGNEQYSEVWWYYPSLNSTVNDRYVVFNYLDNAWYYGTLNRTAWLDSPIRNKPMGAFSIKASYLSAAITSSDTSINLLDASSYPYSGVIQIDSEQIAYTDRTSGALTGCTRGYNSTTAASHVAYSTAGLVAPNQVMYHEIGNDDYSTADGQPITAYISSSDFDIGDGHNFGFIWRIIPDLTFDGSTTPAPDYPSVTMTCLPRQNSGAAYGMPDSPAVTSTQSYNTERVYTIQQFTGQVYTRIRGRQMAFEVQSTDLGVAWQLGAPRIDIRPDGRR
jgi:hypothetical protein